MQTLLISDAHIRCVNDTAFRDLVGLLRARSWDEVVFVGDMVDAWYGSGELPRHVSELAKAATAHVPRVVWLAGNRDPLLSPELEEYGVERAAHFLRAAVYAEHGHLLMFNDKVLSLVLHSTPTQLAAKALGQSRVVALAETLATFSRKAERHNWQEVVMAQRQRADWLLKKHSCDLVIMGHAHAPGVERRSHGRFMNLGSWHDQRTFACMWSGGVQLCHWAGSAIRPWPSGPPRRIIARASRAS